MSSDQSIIVTAIRLHFCEILSDAACIILKAFQIKDVDWDAGTWLPLQLLPLRSPPGEEGVRPFYLHLVKYSTVLKSIKMEVSIGMK